MSKVMKNDEPEAMGTVPSVAMIVYGNIDKYKRVDKETIRRCRIVLEWYRLHAKPIGRYSAEENKFISTERGCVFSVVVFSEISNDGLRKEIVNKTKAHLINVEGLPERCILSVYGKSAKDVCKALRARNFFGDIFVTGKTHLSSHWNSLAKVCRKSGFPPLLYI